MVEKNVKDSIYDAQNSNKYVPSFIAESTMSQELDQWWTGTEPKN